MTTLPALAGKKILITRAASQAEDFAELVRREGGIPVIAPTIEILPPVSWDAFDKALEGLYLYNGVLFTSTNAVRFFAARLNECGIPVTELKQKIICAVGTRTREEIESLGLHVTTMPEKFTASDLASALSGQDLQGQAFLFPRGNLGSTILSDTLKQLGASVDAVTVYRTEKPDPQALEHCRAMLLAGDIDAATFTSPSTFENFISFFRPEEARDILADTLIVSIGPATTRAIEAAGFQIDIQSRQSTTESLVEALIHHFNQTSQ
jgi:uroporphyrinogen-III synthase